MTLYDVDSGNVLQTFKGHKETAYGLAVSPDGTRVVSGGGVHKTEGGANTPIDCGVRIWDAATGKELNKNMDFTKGVTCVAVSPDGKTFLAGCWDRTLRLMDMKTAKEIRRFPGHTSDVSSVAFLPDGKRALSSGGDGNLFLWDVQTAKQSRLCSEVHVCNFSLARDGRHFLTCQPDSTVRLWNLGSDRELHTHREAAGSITYTLAQLSPDGGTAFWATHNKTLVIYRLPQDKP